MPKSYTYSCKKCGLSETVATREAYDALKLTFKQGWTAEHALKKEIRPYKCGPACPLEPYQYFNPKTRRVCVALKRRELIEKDIEEFKAKQAAILEQQAQVKGEEKQEVV